MFQKKDELPDRYRVSAASFAFIGRASGAFGQRDRLQLRPIASASPQFWLCVVSVRSIQSATRFVRRRAKCNVPLAVLLCRH
jgi:hypothetical protein